MFESGQDLINALKDEETLLDESIKEMNETGHRKAIAERDYKIALRQEIFRLNRDERIFIWVTCEELAKGEEEVSKLGYERDFLTSEYEVIKEKIMACKVRINILRDAIKQDLGGQG